MPAAALQVLGVFTSAATALDSQLADAAPHLCRRAVHLIEHDVILAAAAADEARRAGADASTANVAGAGLDKAASCAALDLLGALAEAFGAAFDELVGAAGPSLPGLLYACAQYTPASVRQSAFALLGEMVRFPAGFARFAPSLGPLIVTCAASIKNARHNSDLCNNAIWALGQVVLAAGPAALAAEAAALLPAVTRLTALMRDARELPELLRANAAVALGRIGLVAPAALSAGLGECLAEWAAAALRVHDVTERRHTYEGMCQAVAANPGAAATAGALGNLLVSFAVYEDATPPCVAAMRTILLQLRGLVGDAAWVTLVGRGSIELRAKVADRFGADVVGPGAGR